MVEPHGDLCGAIAAQDPDAVTWWLAEPTTDVLACDDEGFQPLGRAARTGNVAIVQQLLASAAGADDASLRQAFEWAISDGHLGVIEALLDAGAVVGEGLHAAADAGRLEVIRLLVQGNTQQLELDLLDNDGCTALAYAAHGDHAEIVACLTDAGADVNLSVPGGATPIMFAARQGHFSTVKRLLDAGADVRHATTDHGSALLWALDAGHLEVADLLLEHGADVNQLLANGHSLLANAAETGQTDVVTLLLAHGADLDCAQPLLWASYAGNVDIVEILLAAGAEVNQQDEDKGSTALTAASYAGLTDIVELLLHAGADVQLASHFGDTPLACATESFNPAVVRLMVDAFADVDKPNYVGVAPLKSAVPSPEMVAILLTNGADMHVMCDRGETALMDATIRYFHESVQLLLDAGVDVNQANDRGMTALHWDASGSGSIIPQLIKAGANVNAITVDGNTPAHEAAMASACGNLRQLHEAGADLTIRNKDGQTPLDLAPEFTMTPQSKIDDSASLEDSKESVEHPVILSP